jgi:NAD(P)H dehydrogenase (quinone)
MNTISIIYYSGSGHTKKVAESIAKGITATAPSTQPYLIELKKDGSLSEAEWQLLDNADAIIFGTPTYMGSLASPVKIFMENSSHRWSQLRWKDKIAAGFSNSGGLSGDKLCSLISLVVFAMQHGMIWVGNTDSTTGTTTQDKNRITSFLGLMTQADNASPTITPPEGDLQTAYDFGVRVAQITARLKK